MISTTPKIQILIDQLDYFDLTNVILLKLSDELYENIHQYRAKILAKSMYFVKDVSNHNNGARLFRAIGHLNSQNVCIFEE
jgi:hypothetical protein